MSNLHKKVLALTLALVIVFSHLAVLGIYEVAYATDVSNTKTNHANVEFDAYFEDDSHEIELNMASNENTKMYLEVSVENAGYLKNGVIEVSNANFSVDTNYQNEYIQKIEGNKIFLNQIDSNNTVLLELPILFLDAEEVPVDYFSKTSEIKLDGVYVDSQAEENSIEAIRNLKVLWNAETKVIANAGLSKYVPYSANEKYGILVQTKIQANLENNSLPVSSTGIDITVPKINNQNPCYVNVVANHTKATNGREDGKEFNEQNYNYDEETGILNIQVQNNTNENGNISWKKNCTDEYVVTYVYEGKEVYDYGMTNEIPFEVNMEISISAYSSEETNLKGAFLGSIVLKEKTSDVVDFELVNNTKEISKGQIYANYDAKEKYETVYELQYIANIGYADITEYIEFKQEQDNFLTQDDKKGNTTIENVNYVYNKSIKVDIAEFKNILGEEGFIEIYNESGTKIGIINKNSQKDNSYIFDLANLSTNKLTLKTSKPQTEGKLSIVITKAIVGKQAYSKAQMVDFKKLGMTLNASTNLLQDIKESSIELTETVTEAGLLVNTEKLSTVIKNEDVEIRVVLDTSNTSKSLYKNPVIKIKLPKNVEEVTVKKDDILFDDELKIKETKIVEENGQKVIVVKVEGTQTKYNTDAEIKGANIVLNTDITLNSLTPNTKEKIVMYYTNENSKLYAKVDGVTGVDEKEIELVAPSGLVAAAGISNYKEEAEELIAVTDEKVEGELGIYSPARTVTIKGIVINNNNNEISNVEILGRIPFKGNKNVDSNEDLKSTFSTILKSAISINGIDASLVKIYYSTNATASKDLQNVENNWVEELTDFSKVKSYLIVIENQQLETGTKVQFTYDVEVPANLSHNNDVYSNYKVYYKNMLETGTVEEEKVSPMVELSTGKGAELEVTVSSEFEERTEVRSGQIVKYTATIKNVGEDVAENVKLKVTASKNAIHTEYVIGDHAYHDSTDTEKTIEIGDLKPGEIIKKTYELRMGNHSHVDIDEYYKNDEELGEGDEILEDDELPEETTPEQERLTQEELDELINTVSSQVSVLADNLSGELPSNNYKLKIIKGYFKVEVTPMIDESVVLKRDDVTDGYIKIKNITGEDINNVVLKMNIPEGVVLDDVYITDSLLETQKSKEGIEIIDNELKINFAAIKALETKLIKFVMRVENAKEQIVLLANVGNTEVGNHISNKIVYDVDEVKLKIEQKAISNRSIKESQELKYSLTITNTGNIRGTNLLIKNNIPEGTRFLKAEYSHDTGNYKITEIVNEELEIKIAILEPGQSVVINITLKGKAVGANEEKEVINYATLSARGFDEIESNKITYYVEDDPTLENPIDPSNPSGGTTTNPRYKITGTAWIDSNKDGKRDNEESLLPNTKVVLIYKKDNSIVKDVDTNKEKRVITGEDGKYEFDNLISGEYLVVFEYDASKYSLTAYQAKDVDTSLNSDAIDMNMVLDGERKVVGITDVVKVSSSNVRDIDIGVYVSEKFDLRLDKYISKITLTTPTIGTKTYNYDNKQTAKIEILSRNVGQSNIAIEYKIVVTNEGAVAGYVGKVVDYLPQKVKFTTDLNKDWYLAENGNVYNSSLEDTKINPGESKELSLVVTMKITESTLDVLSNKAEIYECYNEQALLDMDSTPGNKVDDEDDLSKAEIVVSLVTGTIIKYITLALGIITILGLSIYMIKTQVLKGKEN